MTISLPDTLTIDNSGKYIMSIRLQPGGLSFSGYIPSGKGSFFYREATFDRNVSYLSSLQEFFFAHDFLTWMYRKVQVMTVSRQYTLVPREIFQEKKKELFLESAFIQPADRCLHQSLNDGAEVVFGIDNEVYEFCSRSFIHPEFTHHIVPTLDFWAIQARNSLYSQMYVVLHDKMIDILCFERGGLSFVNSFAAEREEDILYYILYVWKQTGMDQQKDELHLFGESVLRNQIIRSLSLYIKEVRPVEIPTEAYLAGAEIARAPMDLIILSI